MGRVLTSQDRLDVLCVVCYRNLPLPNAEGKVACECGINYAWPFVLSALQGGHFRDDWKAVVRRDGYQVKVEAVNGVKSVFVTKLVPSG